MSMSSPVPTKPRQRTVGSVEQIYLALRLYRISWSQDFRGEYTVTVSGSKGIFSRSSSLVPPNISELQFAVLDDYENAPEKP